MSKTGPTHTPKDSHYARLRRQHREKKGESGASDGDDDTTLLYGLHSVRAAISNPDRVIHSMSVTENALARLEIGPPDALPFTIDIVHPRQIDKITGPDAVHQGVVLITEPLPPASIESLADANLLLVLDQVTDPHNVGALMRSAVAMDAGGLVTTARHSPTQTGVLAKAASGALEHLPIAQVRNLAEAIEALHGQGFQTIGLDSEGGAALEDAVSGEKIALVLGAEGKGLRQKTRETVDTLARIDMPGAIRSLNVSNAAVLALYIASRSLR